MSKKNAIIVQTVSHVLWLLAVVLYPVFYWIASSNLKVPEDYQLPLYLYVFDKLLIYYPAALLISLCCWLFFVFRKYKLAVVAANLPALWIVMAVTVLAAGNVHVSEQRAEEIAKQYVSTQYREEAVIDEVFLHSGFLGYLVDGHFQDKYQSSFQLIVDHRAGKVSDYKLSYSYTNMKLRLLNDEVKEQLLKKGYQYPEGKGGKKDDTFLIARGCADLNICRIHEVQVALPVESNEDQQAAYKELYEWQKQLPIKIDSISIQNSVTKKAHSRCLRPADFYKSRENQYTLEEFLNSSKCESAGDH
ncbi:hypothetical protein DCC85_12525 [Paenibacillus sp. CAA11]|uniref:DUF4118 domain-containing protein n=1 Tax=Paenibacillus sp. CAA11 TaxID=1532905 RepID=UPI000D372068|nr:DUF4118 domain-containing protein [Paenibacillus sp. CAA11]AWB44962.1 hypothetical protein DCC85_12525 [Paenibacillus sp. CAA11]